MSNGCTNPMGHGWGGGGSGPRKMKCYYCGAEL